MTDRQPPGILLNIYAAPTGSPTPVGIAAPMPDIYRWIGFGWVTDIVEPEPDWVLVDDRLARGRTQARQILIRWRAHRGASMTDLVYRTLIGQGVTCGQRIRMIVPRAVEVEHTFSRGHLFTTITAYATDDGWAIAWHWKPPNETCPAMVD